MSNLETTAVLIDDEPLARDHLRRKLQRLWPKLKIIGDADSGGEGLTTIREVDPDIVFLDIDMPGVSGLDVAEAIPPTCQIVFVTAYDKYALQAFDRAAADYLLKPVSDRRLQRTIAKLKQDKGPVLADVRSLLRQLGDTNSSSICTGCAQGWTMSPSCCPLMRCFFGQNRSTPACSPLTKNI